MYVSLVYIPVCMYKNEEDIDIFEISSLPTRRTSSSGFQVIGIKYKRGLVTLSLGDHCC